MLDQRPNLVSQPAPRHDTRELGPERRFAQTQRPGQRQKIGRRSELAGCFFLVARHAAGLLVILEGKLGKSATFGFGVRCSARTDGLDTQKYGREVGKQSIRDLSG